MMTDAEIASEKAAIASKINALLLANGVAQSWVTDSIIDWAFQGVDSMINDARSKAAQ